MKKVLRGLNGSVIFVVLLIVGLLLLHQQWRGMAEAKTIRLSFGTVYPQQAGLPIDMTKVFWAEEIKKRVESQTEHKVQWVFAYAGAVAKHGEVLEAVQKGILDTGLLTTPSEPVKLPLHSLGYFVPFSSVDTVLINKVTNQLFDEIPYMKQVYEKEFNQKCLTVCLIDSLQLLTKFAWKTLDDLKKHKIAAIGPNLGLVKAAGATPVQSNMAEAYTSLQTGVYEGWITPLIGILGFKLYEHAPYLTFCDFGATIFGNITVNLDKFNSLPKEVQDILVQVSKEYDDKVAQGLLEQRTKDIETLKKANVHISELSWDQKVRWAKMLPNMPDIKAKEANSKGLPGTKVVGRYIELMVQAGHKFPRQWKIENYK